MIDSDFKAHLKLTTKVLGTLENSGMKIKHMLCQWFKTEVRFSGHVVNRMGLRKVFEYIKKVTEYSQNSDKEKT